MMIAPQFGDVCSSSEDVALANHLAIWLARIEEEMKGANLKRTLLDCECDTEYLTPEEKRKKEEKTEAVIENLYPTHNSHLLLLIAHIVDDLGKITVEIDRIQHADVNLLLRQHYYELKADMCENVDAKAYHLNK
jgi:hypothetical protein